MVICDGCGVSSTTEPVLDFSAEVLLGCKGYRRERIAPVFNNTLELCEKCQDDLFAYLKNAYVSWGKEKADARAKTADVSERM